MARLRLPAGLLIEGAGYEDLSAELQGLAPGKTTRRPHREVLAADLGSGAVAYERRTPRNDHSLRWRRFIFTPTSWGVVDFTVPYGVTRDAVVPDSVLAGFRRRVPHLLLAEALHSGTKLQLLTAGVVAMPLAGGDTLTLHFDRAPELIRVAYRAHVPGLGDVPIAMEFTGWKNHPQLGRFPSGHRVRIGGRVLQEVRYERIVVDGPAIAQHLAVPDSLRAGAPMGPMPMGSMPGNAAAARPHDGSVSEVAPGVYVVYNLHGFHLLFVDLGAEILAVEAPEVHPLIDAVPSRGAPPALRLTREYLDLIARTLPGKRVRYLVVSHHHGDHSGGGREFMAQGVTVLAPPGDVGFLKQLARAPHTLRRDALTGRSIPPVIEGVAERKHVAGSARAVEILRVGPNPHTDDNLVVWIPSAGILFQGDLFYHNDGDSAPPPSRVTMNRFFAGWLARTGLEPTRVYGLHNTGFATIEQVRRAGALQRAPSGG